MSLVNMQDGVVKSPLVQQVQQRGADLSRVQQSTQVPFNQELARQADEVVLQTAEAENEGIRPDEEGKQDHPQKRRKPAEGEEGPDEEPPEEGMSDNASHRIDITV